MNQAIKAAFSPAWPHNPYQNELKLALAEQGVELVRAQQLKRIQKEFLRERGRLQILHLHGLPGFTLQPLKLARYCAFFWRLKQMHLAGVRIVWTLHNQGNHDAPFLEIERRVEARLARSVDALIVHGATAKRIAIECWGGEIAPRIHVIPHGNYVRSYPNTIGQPAARNRLGLGPTDLVLLFFGQIRPYKGLPQLIQDFRALRDPELRLVVAGRPVDKMIGKEIAAAVHGDARILLKSGQVNDDEIQVYLNACDAVVLPYRKVFTSGAAILAMSFGKACVVPRTGCVVDALDSEGAIFFDPDSVGSVARALVELLAKRDDLGRMGRYNRARVEAWDWSAVARSTGAVYRSCLVDGDIKQGIRSFQITARP